MALLPYVDESKASEKTKEILGNTPRKLNVARMIANASDAVFQNFSRLGNALMTKGKLNSRLREIAILRNARVSGSIYEYTQHVPIAKAVGVSDDQIKGRRLLRAEQGLVLRGGHEDVVTVAVAIGPDALDANMRQPLRSGNGEF